MPANGTVRARFAVKVVPRSSRDELAGWIGDALKVRVTAPPERGRANTAVHALLAGALRLPHDRIRLVAGASSPRKLFEVEGLDEVEVRRRLEAAVE
jgi:hypothetical protein